MKIKFCDKCEKSEQETEIKRIAFQTHFPNYDYFGLDLCDKCLTELKVLLADYLGEVEK